MIAQSILFDRASWTAGAARAWLRSRGYRAGAADPTEHFLRYRQRAPAAFSRLRTVPFGDGIQAVMGPLKRARKANPEDAHAARERALRPLLRAARELVRQVNHGAGPDVEGALYAQALDIAESLDEQGLPGTRILRAVMREMRDRQAPLFGGGAARKNPATVYRNHTIRPVLGGFRVEPYGVVLGSLSRAKRWVDENGLYTRANPGWGSTIAVPVGQGLLVDGMPVLPNPVPRRRWRNPR